MRFLSWVHISRWKTIEKNCLSLHIIPSKGAYDWDGLSLLTGQGSLSGLSTILFSHSFLTVSLEGSHCTQPTLKEWGVRLFLLENIYINYLELLCKGDFIPPPCTYSFHHYLYQCGLMSILYFGFKFNTTLFIPHIVVALAPESSFIWLVCAFVRLIAYIPCPSSRISHFSKQPWFLFGEWY